MISIIKNSKVQFEFGSRDILGARGRPTRVCYCSRAGKGLVLWLTFHFLRHYVEWRGITRNYDVYVYLTGGLVIIIFK